MSAARDRRDRCPGALRPWPADDGLLVRLRLIGGRLPVDALRELLTVAEEHGDGAVHLTGRANLQLRGLPGTGGRLDEPVLAALEATGLLPTRTHELVRNVMVSPCTGITGGRTDLRRVASDLDAALCADPTVASLPGRFLFVLDDGRGDLLDRTCDLGLVALDDTCGQLRIGAGFGEVIDLDDAASTLARLAARFNTDRGDTPDAPWHVNELDAPLVPPHEPDPRMPTPSAALAWGPVPGGVHLAAPESGLRRAQVEDLVERAHRAETAEVIVTPWRGVVIAEKNPPNPPTSDDPPAREVEKSE